MCQIYDHSLFITKYDRNNFPTHFQEVTEGISKNLGDEKSTAVRSSEVTVIFKNLGDESIEVILGDDIDKPNPRKWVVHPGFIIPHQFSSERAHNLLMKRGRMVKTMGFYFTKQQQDIDCSKFFA